MRAVANENPFYLPVLLSPNKFHFGVKELKEQSYLEKESLPRSESFHHESSQPQLARVVRNASDVSLDGCPSPSQQQLSLHSYPSPPRQDESQVDPSGTSHLPKPWAAVKDPHSGRTYYWNQQTNKVQWEPPKAQPVQSETPKVQSILKRNGVRTRGYPQYFDQPRLSQGCQSPKKVRFDFSEQALEAARDAQYTPTSFSWLEIIREAAWDALSGSSPSDASSGGTVISL